MGGAASRVAMDIRQGLLNDAKNGQSQIARQTIAEFRGQLCARVDSAALREPVYVPAQRRIETYLVQQRRMQQVRHGADLFGGLLYQKAGLFERLLGSRSEASLLPANDGEIHADACEELTYAVVQFPGNAPSFFVLDAQQPSGE